jgi:hypothetical protein
MQMLYYSKNCFAQRPFIVNDYKTFSGKVPEKLQQTSQPLESPKLNFCNCKDLCPQLPAKTFRPTKTTPKGEKSLSTLYFMPILVSAKAVPKHFKAETLLCCGS